MPTKAKYAQKKALKIKSRIISYPAHKKTNV
jgi:hypothetical protein